MSLPLVENGNSVAMAVGVDHPMNAGNPVTAIALFNEKSRKRRSRYSTFLR